MEQWSRTVVMLRRPVALVIHYVILIPLLLIPKAHVDASGVLLLKTNDDVGPTFILW
jgi:hypothetical protein